MRIGIAAQEHHRVLAFALLVMAFTTIPYVVGFAAQGSQWRFSGFLIGREDGNSYLAKMREGAEGDWLFHLAYTSEQHDGVLLFVPYLLGGKLASLISSLSGLALTSAMLLVFHAARFLFGILVIVISHRFVSLILPRGHWRWLALVVITLGGGLGWLLFFLGQSQPFGTPPIEFYSPEAYTFLDLYSLPHLALARAALLGGFILLLRAQETGQMRLAWLAGGSWLIMGLCVPFDLAVVYVLLMAWGTAVFLRTRRLWRIWVTCAAAAIISAPILIYSIVLTVVNPAFALFNAQNVLPSPNPIHYLVGYGVVIPIALLGVYWAWKRGEYRLTYLLLVSWPIAAILLAYTPISVQRRLLEGIFVPLCILAVEGIRLLVHLVSKSYKRPLSLGLTGLVLAVTLPSYTLVWGLGVLDAVNREMLLFYPTGEVEALQWLGDHAPRNAVILSDFEVGNAIPVFADLRAFIGHSVETLHLSQKNPAATAFFNGNEPLSQLQTADEDPIAYVIFSPAEPDPHHAPQWANVTPVYDNDGYVIYQVQTAMGQ